jgi:hypothetical protein
MLLALKCQSSEYSVLTSSATKQAVSRVGWLVVSLPGL